MKLNSILSLSLTWFNNIISSSGPPQPSNNYLNYELIPLIPVENRSSEPGLKEWWEDFLGLFGADTASKKIKFIEQKFDKIESTKREKLQLDSDYSKIDFGPPNDHWDRFPLFVKDMADNYYNQALTHSLDYFKIIINGVNSNIKGIELHNLGVQSYNNFAKLDPIKEIRDMNHLNRMDRLTNTTDPKFIYFIHSNRHYFKIVNLARHHFNSLKSLADEYQKRFE